MLYYTHGRVAQWQSTYLISKGAMGRFHARPPYLSNLGYNLEVTGSIPGRPTLCFQPLTFWPFLVQYEIHLQGTAIQP